MAFFVPLNPLHAVCFWLTDRGRRRPVVELARLIARGQERWGAFVVATGRRDLNTFGVTAKMTAPKMGQRQRLESTAIQRIALFQRASSSTVCYTPSLCVRVPPHFDFALWAVGENKTLIDAEQEVSPLFCWRLDQE